MFDLGGPARARHILGNYELFEEIGRGGMGLVYRALDLSLDRVVAVKILRDDLRAQPQIVSRFSREAKAAACLDHPNIVQIYSVGAVDGTPYIAMEFVDAVPLSTLMQRENDLDWEMALHIAAQVASALACAHDAHVIHRDIKPPNILITDEGKAFVTDFGIAKILTMNDDLTIDGSRLGTLHYMSPERCKNGNLTGSSDLYSLGVLLFQMLSGRLPYEAASSMELIRRIVSDPPQRLRQFRPDVPESVERLVAWMIEKHPKHRPANGGVVREAIERVREGKPLDIGTSTMTSVLADFRHSYSRAAGADTPQHLASGLTPITVALPPEWKRRTRIGAALAAGAVFLAVVVSALVGRAQSAANAWSSEQTNPSRWFAPPDVGAYSEETPGVTLVHLNLPEFTIDRLGWAAPPAELLVQLNGRNQTHHQGQRVLCGLNPIQRQASIVVPPDFPLHPAAEDSPLAALAFSETLSAGAPLAGRAVIAWRNPGFEGSAPFQALYACPTDGTHAEGAALLARIPADEGVRVDAVAVHPNGATLAVVLRTGDATASLVEWNAGPGGLFQRGRSLAVSGAPISSVQYAPDGTRVAFLREDAPGEYALWVVPVDGSDSLENPLTRGPIAMTGQAFAPDGATLAITETGPAGESHVRLIRAADGQVLKEFGEGSNASWHPSGTRLIATAPDRKDLTQLWALETEAPYRRVQLTYLDGGISHWCAVSADGLWAASTTMKNRDPVLVLVHVAAAS